VYFSNAEIRQGLDYLLYCFSHKEIRQEPCRAYTIHVGAAYSKKDPDGPVYFQHIIFHSMNVKQEAVLLMNKYWV
jgi:hypothetical protein